MGDELKALLDAVSKLRPLLADPLHFAHLKSVSTLQFRLLPFSRALSPSVSLCVSLCLSVSLCRFVQLGLGLSSQRRTRAWKVRERPRGSVCVSLCHGRFSLAGRRDVIAGWGIWSPGAIRRELGLEPFLGPREADLVTRCVNWE